MPTLIQINTCLNSGSTGRIAEEIGQIVMNAGWTSFIAYARESNQSQSHVIKIGNERSVIWHGLDTRLFDRQGLASRCATQQLIKRIEAIHPDIIHLHNIHGYYLNYPILFEYLSRAGIPVVWTLHDCWAMTGHCSYFTFAGCERWKTGCFDCPQKREYPSSLLFDRSRQNYADKKRCFNSVKNMTIVPVSDWLTNIVHESFFKDYPVHRIYNGVNTEVFSPQDNKTTVRSKNGIHTPYMLIGVANIWSERKGLNDFIKLAGILPDDCMIALVGLSEKQMRNLPQNIKGVRRTESTKELAELYSAADLFVNPTWEDNFPTTNLEALACGTPVATYRTGGSIEAVTPETGFIVEQGDIQGLLKVIEQMKSKGKKAYTIACRQRALDCFRKEDRYSEYLALYEELINNK